MFVRQDELHVRMFAKGNDQGERVIVDLEEDPTTDRFIMLDSSGGVVCLGAERLGLSWPALLQLSELIQNGAKTYKVRPVKKSP